MLEQTNLVSMIDEALVRFGPRDLISGAEIVDFLLDLRLGILATDAELAALLDEERQPTA
ncbi:MAG: hypothetical protein EXQ69_11000 [Acidimicrobiia bacterium]|nr:hypothetical protein [Acidimicrobiia bacterium]